MTVVLPCHACGMSFTDCLNLHPVEAEGDETCCEECDHSRAADGETAKTDGSVSDD